MSLDTRKLGGPYETVIDVGAFRGDFARAALARWRTAKVLSFEPLEKAPRAIQGFRRRWTWYGCALGNEVGRRTMHACEFVPSSSMLPMLDLHREAFPYTAGGTEVEVGIAMLDEFEEQIVEPALLKVDVQGYELEVLKGGVEVLQKCTAVVCEVSHEPLYEGATTAKELEEFLGARGFKVYDTIDALYHPKDEKRLLQTDDLWVREVDHEVGVER